MTDNTPILVADIGGTNARFSLADTDGKLIPECPKVVATADYDSLQDAANAYLETSTRPRPKLAAIAIAAFIAHDTIQMTNCPWTFKKSALATDLHVERVNILNDFEAIACALPVLNDTDLQQIGGSEIDITGNKVVIGPGTGVGVACLTPVGDGWKVITSEGGHISFAPVNDLEHDILRTVKKLYPRVSVERIISGQGLSTLYQAFQLFRENPHNN
ncbi:MAG: glucokinase [Kordiimonadaceae bacterium]|nr:glucokinase [Kordiimonadaceae bacterium]